ncbi:MAG: hypothetical protein IID08_06735 [Candidatus Hydrogenedentes bacterium]|nr:hypothetical protein [Candidatus Hydrogenedentota bacterium]
MKRPSLVFLPALFVVALFLPGCAEEEAPQVVAPTIATPAPPTPQEIADRIANEMGLNEPLPPPGSTLPPGTASAFKQDITRIKGEQSAAEEGAVVLGFLSSKIENRIRQVERSKLWHHVLIYEEAYRVLNPRSQKFKRQRDKAIIELKRPSVSLTGFMYDGRNDTTIAFLEINMPLEDILYEERLRPGEEIHGLKLIKIIGNNQGVTFEFIESGDFFDVYMKSAQQTNR